MTPLKIIATGTALTIVVGILGSYVIAFVMGTDTAVDLRHLFCFNVGLASGATACMAHVWMAAKL
jgi:hypothetical protein